VVAEGHSQKLGCSPEDQHIAHPLSFLLHQGKEIQFKSQVQHTSNISYMQVP
jgi:hypothetical protein